MKLFYIIKLMRPVNLLIIAISMIALRYLIFMPVLADYGIYLRISHLDFMLLVLGTLLIAGAGNIINDYFDIKPDRLNKHHHVIVGKHVKRREAIVTHVFMSTLGFLLSAYVAIKYGIPWMLLFQVIAITLLWLYSASFKNSFLFGNVIVAFLTACVPLIVISYDLPVIFKAEGFSFPYLSASLHPYKEIIFITLCYAAFAFFLNLIREIQKDMADIRGDKEIGAKTIPIELGIPTSRKIVNSLTLFVILALIYIQQAFVADKISSLYLLIFIVIPLILSAAKLRNAKKSSQFLRASLYTKVAMAGGLGYLILFYFLITNQFFL
jgi:4-hydroxybenzoate polyprenyltransferase